MAKKPKDDDTPIWGAEAIAHEINKPVRATYHLLEQGLLPAKKVGGSWVSTPRRLQAGIAVGAALPPRPDADARPAALIRRRAARRPNAGGAP